MEKAWRTQNKQDKLHVAYAKDKRTKYFVGKARRARTKERRKRGFKRPFGKVESQDERIKLDWPSHATLNRK